MSIMQSISNSPPLALQTLFDAAVTHLLKQDAKANDTKKCDRVPRCMYRASNGLKCGIGGILPDDKYDPAFEGKGVNALPAPVLESMGIIDEGTELLAQRVQSIHDQLPVSLWAVALRILARNFGISARVLDVAEEKVRFYTSE